MINRYIVQPAYRPAPSGTYEVFDLAAERGANRIASFPASLNPTAFESARQAAAALNSEANSAFRA
jgi:hypothetical protein